MRWKHPFIVAVFLGLLANISMHGFGTALGLVLALGIERLRFRDESYEQSRSLLLPVLLLSIFMAFALWCILPAQDAGWVVVLNQMHSREYLSAKVAGAMPLHPWMNHLGSRSAIVATMLIELARGIGQGLAYHHHLGLITWFLLVLRWIRFGTLQYVIPVLILGELCPPMSTHFYHAGLLWVLFLFLWWITWPNPGTNSVADSGRFARWNEMLLLCFASACLLIQISWGFTVLRFDALNPYSPSRDGAAVLKSYLASGNRVYVAVPSPLDGEGHGAFYITDMEPYFDHQPISNMPFRFWFWVWGYDMRPAYLQASSNRSAIIVAEEVNEDPRYKIEEKRLVSLGYHRDKVVCGTITYPVDSFRVCHAFYKP